MTTDVRAVHNGAESRFEVIKDGLLAELTYRRRGDLIIFLHTGVPDALEGQGIGSALAQTGLDFARSEGLEVVPRCPFVRGYIKRHPEYQVLVKRQS